MKLSKSTFVFFLVLVCCSACGKSDLLSRLTDPSKPWERSQASDEMRMLSMEEQRKLVTALIEKLSAWNKYVRQNAAETLGELDEVADEAIPFLQKIAISDTNKNVVLVSIVSLARLGVDTNQTLGILIERLGSRSGGVEGMLIRHGAANYIGFIASGSRHPNVVVAIPALVLTLQDSDSSVRSRAAWALGSSGKQAESAIKELKESAWNDRSRNVRYLASWALKKIGTPDADAALEGWVLPNSDQFSE